MGISVCVITFLLLIIYQDGRPDIVSSYLRTPEWQTEHIYTYTGMLNHPDSVRYFLKRSLPKYHHTVYKRAFNSLDSLFVFHSVIMFST